MFGAPAGERSISGGGELGWENPEALRTPRDHGGGKGRFLGAWKGERLGFWPVVLDSRTEFWDLGASWGSCIYGRPRESGKGANTSEKMTG